jgi:hypothetical protein
MQVGSATVDESKEGVFEMNVLFLLIVIGFVVAVLGVVGYALFELTPLARHVDRYRDPRTGERRLKSPHLDG